MGTKKKVTPKTAAISAPVDKAAKFRTIAGRRTSNAIRAIEMIGNCSNRSSYDYNEEQVEKIFGLLLVAVNETRQKFIPKKDKVKTTVEL